MPIATADLLLRRQYNAVAAAAIAAAAGSLDCSGGGGERCAVAARWLGWQAGLPVRCVAPGPTQLGVERGDPPGGGPATDIQVRTHGPLYALALYVWASGHDPLLGT